MEKKTIQYLILNSKIMAKIMCKNVMMLILYSKLSILKNIAFQVRKSDQTVGTILLVGYNEGEGPWTLSRVLYPNLLNLGQVMWLDIPALQAQEGVWVVTSSPDPVLAGFSKHRLVALGGGP